MKKLTILACGLILVGWALGLPSAQAEPPARAQAVTVASQNVLRGRGVDRRLRGNPDTPSEPLLLPGQSDAGVRARPLAPIGSRPVPEVPVPAARPRGTAVTELRFRPVSGSVSIAAGSNTPQQYRPAVRLTEARQFRAADTRSPDRAVRRASYLERPSGHWAKPERRIFFLAAPLLEGGTSMTP